MPCPFPFPFANILGKPNTGVHSIRLFGLSVIDADKILDTKK